MGKVRSPEALVLNSVVITSIPRISRRGCKPYLEIFSGMGKTLIYSGKTSTGLSFYKSASNSKSEEALQQISIVPFTPLVLAGDLDLSLKH